MQAHWNVWSDAKSEKSARHVANRLLRELHRSAHDLTFERYPKTGGWTFSFETELEGATWNDRVVDLIAIGQRVAYSWELSGNVALARELRSQLEGWSNESRISGVTATQWQLWPPETVDGAEGDAIDQ